MDDLPRESVEYVYITVTDNGQAVTSGLEVALTREVSGDRPTEWIIPDDVDGTPALAISDKAPGRYIVWARWTVGAEQPVRACGVITIT